MFKFNKNFQCYRFQCFDLLLFEKSEEWATRQDLTKREIYHAKKTHLFPKLHKELSKNLYIYICSYETYADPIIILENIVTQDYNLVRCNYPANTKRGGYSFHDINFFATKNKFYRYYL